VRRGERLPRLQTICPPCRKIFLAFDAAQSDIVAVRHDLSHMPSLGVSSLDLGRLWRHRRPPFSRPSKAFGRRKAEHSPSLGKIARLLGRHRRLGDLARDAQDQGLDDSEKVSGKL
jgi:hypothetical protein